MGMLLSISPTSKKEAILDDRKEGDPEIKTGSVKKQSMLVSALTFKRMVAESTMKKSCKKVNPNATQVNNSHENQLNNENNKKSQQSSTDGKKGPLTVPVPMVTTQSLQPNQPQVPSENVKLLAVQKQPSKVDLLSPRRVIIQASTGELLRCLGEFMCRRCYKVKLTYSEVIIWFRNVDRTLLLQGWQDQGFITPANLVFVYLLCKESIPNDIGSASELQGIFLLCLYLSYSYMGCEISYPLKPFMIMANEDNFWDSSMSIINNTSAKMLQLNADPYFFTEVFQELKDEGKSRDKDLDH